LENEPCSKWLNKPWMYSKPKNVETLAGWRKTWLNFIIEYAKRQNIHLININDLKQMHPFNMMDQEAFDDIINSLVQQRYGEWWDKNKKMLRIYWLSLEKWAEYVAQTARNKEKSVIYGIKDIVELEPRLTAMPEKDIKTIIRLMVELNLARWIDKRKMVIKIK